MSGLRPPEIGVITNPNSRKNRNRRRRLEQLRKIVGTRGLVRQTADVTELRPVLQEFAQSGMRYWVTDGGDGSLHWMLNEAAQVFGGLDQLHAGIPCAVPTNGGTIDFVARHAGLKGNAEDILRRLVELERRGKTAPSVEVPTILLRGKLEDSTGETRDFERLGFAAAVAGIGAGFFEKYYEVSQRGGTRAILEVVAKGATAFVMGTGPLKGAATKGMQEYAETVRAVVPGTVWVDGRRLPYTKLTALNVGAFPINLGGVIKVFGKAEPGQTMHVMAGEISELGVVRNLPRLFRGRDVKSSRLFDAPAKHLRAVASERTFKAVLDGEFIEGVREVEITLGPPVRVPTMNARRG